MTGSDFLTLWNINKDFGKLHASIIWSMIQPSPVYLLSFSQDSNMAASCGKYDTLLKVWNRIAFGEHSLFDMTYLLHSTPVTSIRWKRYTEETLKHHETYTNTLYSLAADSVLRIWSSYEHENCPLIQHWGSINLYEDQVDKSGKRFALIIDNHLVHDIISTALKDSYNENLDELQSSNSDIVIVANTQGEFVLYSLKNLSQNPPKLMDYNKLKTMKFVNHSFVKNPEFIHFSEPISYGNGDLSIVIHDLKGVVRHSTINLKEIIGQSELTEAGILAHKLTGHEKSIQKMIRTSDGEALLTISRFNENAVWVPQYLKESVTLNKKSIVHTPNPISKAVILDRGNLLITLCGSELCLWNTSAKVANRTVSLKIEHEGKPLSFANIPMRPHVKGVHYVIAIYKSKTLAWIVKKDSIIKVDVDTVPIDDDIHIVSPVDYVGLHLDYHRPILSTITKSGLLRSYYSVLENGRIKFNEGSNIETGIKNPSYVRGSSIYKFVVVDETCKKLTIWDLTRNVLEYEEVFENNILDIDWTSTKYKQSILAIGFKSYSMLYTQLRYDYTNHNPTFLPIKKIDITDFTTHEIGDSMWLKDGIMVIATGNQLFITDKSLDLKNDKFAQKSVGSRNIVSNNILNLCSVLNGPLPLYHPQLLIQCLFIGKLELVKELLLRLFLKLRELEINSRSIDEIGTLLDFDILKFTDSSFKPSEFEEPYTEFNEMVSSQLIEKLMKVSLPYLTRHQQITLVSTIESIFYIDKNILSLDASGSRFCLGLKLFQLHKDKTQERLNLRDINWALHSENKEILLQLVENSIINRKITWNVCKSYRLTYWMKHEDLMIKMEEIARNEFNLNEVRDPINCSIFYLALKKKSVLIGLWRTSTGHPEQQKMLNFLKNDFSEKRWRTAALKNAYVLLSKHRYILAACFFLLGDSLKDCCNVLVRQVKDIDLAIGICRVYEGDNGPVLTDVLKNHVLPEAVIAGDRWNASYVFWKTGERSRAIQALVRSPFDMLNDDERKVVEITEKSKSFLEDDPLLLILYQSLREKNPEYFKGSLEISVKEESEFLLRVASIYTRMGCDYLSLSILKNWSFIKMKDRETKTRINQSDESDLLEKFGFSPTAKIRKNTLIEYEAVSDSEKDAADNTNPVAEPPKANMSILEKYGLAQKVKKIEDEDEIKVDLSNKAAPPPTAFQEPDMSSFDFGF